MLEPAFYWRVQRDYDDVPPPTVVFFDPKKNLEAVREAVDAARSASMKSGKTATRIVLQSSTPYFPSVRYAIPSVYNKMNEEMKLKKGGFRMFDTSLKVIM